MLAHRLMHAALRRAVLGPCRKAKQSMLTDGVQGLQKLKKKGKGVTKAIIEEREKQVHRPHQPAPAAAAAAPSTTGAGGTRSSPVCYPTQCRRPRRPDTEGFSSSGCDSSHERAPACPCATYHRSRS